MLERPTPIPPQFWGCSPWPRLPMLWLRGAKTLSQLFVSKFQTNSTHTPTVGVTDGQTDGRMTYCSSTAR